MGSVGTPRDITRCLIKKIGFKSRRRAEKRSLKNRKNLIERVNLILDESILDEEYNQSNISENSFHTNELSELMSIKSFNNEDLQPKVFVFCSSKQPQSVKRRKSKRFKMNTNEASSIFEQSIISSEVDVEVHKPNDVMILQESVLQKIREIRNLPKNLNNKKSVFALTRKYNLIQSETMMAESNEATAKLTVSKLHFSNIPQKVGQNNYFVLVSCGREVQTSDWVKTKNNFVTFEDVFTFENCPLNFRIRVQLYVFKLNAKLKMMMRKAPLMDRIYEWYKSRSEEKNDDLAESSCFEFLDHFELTREDLQRNLVGTVRDKISLSNIFKYSLKIDHLCVPRQRNGFLRMYLKSEEKWQRFWCVLFGTALKIYSSESSEYSPVLYLDLKYATYSKIDRDDVLIFKHVRPSKENEENEPTLESRNNFVVIQHLFKAVNLRYLHLWMSDINAVIKSLDEWNFSFLYSTELDM